MSRLYLLFVLAISSIPAVSQDLHLPIHANSPPIDIELARGKERAKMAGAFADRIGSVRLSAAAFRAGAERARRSKPRMTTGAHVEFKFFDGTRAVFAPIRLEEPRTGSATWVGEPADGTYGNANITVSDDATYGVIDYGLDRYVIQRGTDGVTYMSKVDLRQLDGLSCAANSVERKQGKSTKKPSAHAKDGTHASGETVDVLVLYTSAVSTRQGGPAAVATFADNLISSANSSLSASGVSASFRVAGYSYSSYAEPTEMTEAAYEDLIADMAGSVNDFSGLATLRTNVGADRVIILLDGSTVGFYCGAASQLTATGTHDNQKAQAFAAALDTCAANDYYHTHELGHTLADDIIGATTRKRHRLPGVMATRRWHLVFVRSCRMRPVSPTHAIRQAGASA